MNVTNSTGTAQLHRRKDGIVEVFESGSGGTMRHFSNDLTHWYHDEKPVWTSPGGFLYAVKPNSGSIDDGNLRGIQTLKTGEGKFRLEQILASEQ
jgi:hypothetical protein